jgi:hypothetical protein
MSPFDFEQEMNRLRPEFRSLELTDAKNQMIFAAAKDLPRESLAKVVTHMIATFRRAPTVQDFIDGLASDRRAYAPHAPVEPYKPTCYRCDDLGITMGSFDDWDGLMICKCDRGSLQPWDLPRLKEFPVARVQALPHEMFSGNLKRQSSLSEEDEKRLARQNVRRIREKGLWWRETIRIAEQNWITYRQQHD